MKKLALLVLMFYVALVAIAPAAAVVGTFCDGDCGGGGCPIPPDDGGGCPPDNGGDDCGGGG